jgi:hypothetical protein
MKMNEMYDVIEAAKEQKRINKRSLKAMRYAVNQFEGFLNCCDEQEIRQSFQGFVKAVRLLDESIRDLA